MKNNIFAERKEYNNVITVKIVVPSACNAECPFCYNKDKNMACDKYDFLSRFMTSLKDILDRISDKNPVSVDITGGEPTLDVSLVKDILYQLRENNIHDRVCRITMTTNGFHLKDIVNDLCGVVDYVNISVHDYRSLIRKQIMGENALLYSDDYRSAVMALMNRGIPCSCSSVVCNEIHNFSVWMDEFIKWAKKIGFIAIRFRYCCNQEIKNISFDKYMLETLARENEFQTITHEQTPDSHWCRLRRKQDGFRLFFLHGVTDTSLVTKGIEYVIDNDGRCYCDYYKRTHIDDYEYEIGKIYDLIFDGSNAYEKHMS